MQIGIFGPAKRLIIIIILNLDSNRFLLLLRFLNCPIYSQNGLQLDVLKIEYINIISFNSYR